MQMRGTVTSRGENAMLLGQPGNQSSASRPKGRPSPLGAPQGAAPGHSCVRRPGGALRHLAHSHRAAEAVGRADDAGLGRRTRTSTGSASSLNSRFRRPAGAASLAAPTASRSAFARGARRAGTIAAAGGRSSCRALTGRGPRAWPAALALLAGLALAAPVQAQTSISLVSNLGERNAILSIDDQDYRIPFTTGSHRGGYKLTGVTLQFGQMDTSTVAFGVFVLDSDAATSLGGGALNAPATLAVGNNTFTHSGIDLKANTTYYVWFEVTGQGNGEGVIGRTTSNNEDSGALLGWSIGDDGEERDWNIATWSSDTVIPVFAIEGYAKEPTTTPTVDLVRVVSAPTHDSDSDGQFDTYVRDDEILFDVEYSEPVVVAGGNSNVRVRVDLGTDDTDLANSRKTASLQSVLYGGRTLRFAYAVTASDTDPDVVWVQTAGSNNQVVFLAGTPTATVRNPLTGKDADLTKAGLPTEGGRLEGAVRAKVDGSVASSAGPTPVAAEVNGATLTVSFDKAISWTSDDDLIMNLEVRSTGDVNGGNRNANQHPQKVAHGEFNGELVLTLGIPAKASDTVTLSHFFSGGKQVLQDILGNKAAAFRDLAVTNNTPGAASAPVPLRAEVGGERAAGGVRQRAGQRLRAGGHAVRGQLERQRLQSGHARRHGHGDRQRTPGPGHAGR